MKSNKILKLITTYFNQNQHNNRRNILLLQLPISVYRVIQSVAVLWNFNNANDEYDNDHANDDDN